MRTMQTTRIRGTWAKPIVTKLTEKEEIRQVNFVEEVPIKSKDDNTFKIGDKVMINHTNFSIRQLSLIRHGMVLLK